jgi:hypothetical protein
MKGLAIILIVVGLAVGFLGLSAGGSQAQVGILSGLVVSCGVILLLVSVFAASRREAIEKVTEQYESLRGPDGEMPPDVDLREDPDRMLAALGRLRDKKIITEAQFEEQRARILSTDT